nr:MAG TPA: hypothetical protein [Caudoviricetes sp.]
MFNRVYSRRTRVDQSCDVSYINHWINDYIGWIPIS